jgi:hypothetical protein
MMEVSIKWKIFIHDFVEKTFFKIVNGEYTCKNGHKYHCGECFGIKKCGKSEEMFRRKKNICIRFMKDNKRSPICGKVGTVGCIFCGKKRCKHLGKKPCPCHESIKTKY